MKRVAKERTCAGRITDYHDDSAQVVARGGDALVEHEANGAQLQHKGHIGVRLERDYVGSSRISTANGKGACGGVSCPK